jgi:hypothetical protein
LVQGDNMKKLTVLAIIALFLLCGSSLTTRISSYTNLVVSAAGAETDLVAATGYNVGVPAPGTTALAPKDLLQKFGSRYDTYANNIGLVCSASAANDDSATMSLYGIVDGGAPERIASLVWDFGTAIKSGTIRWADTCTATGTHVTAVTATDSGNNRICKVTFDATGYRYLYGIVHATVSGAATGITVDMRHW